MPSSIRHKVETLGMGQPNFATCWWASYRMMFKYWKRNLDEIDTRLAAASIDVEDCKAKGLPDTEYFKAANTLGLVSWSGLTFNQAPGLLDIGLSDGAEAFLKELALGPLWVSKRVKGGNHIIVAVAYDDSARTIHCNNPHPGPNDAVEQPGVDANLFVRTITAAKGSVQAFRYKLGDS
ncbi:MAG: hypothetical protein JNL98_06600 [Bryobacterales bacterium]|nr:hypothetical protein [Bryobacterales bacterium]